MLKFRPSFQLHSERPAWVQALRGAASFAIAAAVLVGGLTAAGIVQGVWDRHHRRDPTVEYLADQGLRSVCVGKVDAKCAQRAADAAGVDVAYIESANGYLAVSIDDRAPKAEESYGRIGVESLPPGGAGGKYLRHYRTIVVDDTEIDLWQFVVLRCKCPTRDVAQTGGTHVGVTTTTTSPRVYIASATWFHAGHMYELKTPASVDAISLFRRSLPDIRYASPKARR
ncbi:MAG: hypothetical protein JWM72_1074 [Actinomycetia bacterium]|nr:hypothetical protein [Actinomycetes bacterium]